MTRPDPSIHRKKAEGLRIASLAVMVNMSAVNDTARELEAFDGDREHLEELAADAVKADGQWNVDRKAYFATEVNFLDDYREYVTDAIEHEIDLMEKQTDLLEKMVGLLEPSDDGLRDRLDDRD